MRRAMLSTAIWLSLLARVAVSADPPFVFRDVGEQAGIFPHAEAIRGHGAAWGDVDGDGWADLFIATFHNAGS